MQGFIKRTITKYVQQDLQKKMVFIGGPRQSGKTTLATQLLDALGLDQKRRYLNWDAPRDREDIIKEQFPAESGLLVLDEVHKYKRWRQVVKGLFDKRKDEIQVLVTGSARLDHYRRGGDSLQGRYFFYRLFPFTLAELGSPAHSTVTELLQYGGFPEQFLQASQRESRRWSRDYRTRIVREDLRDLERIQEIDTIEQMVLRLPELVGSPLSLNALREDLQVSHQSVSRWVSMLENLYLLFRIYPFGSPKVRAVKKEAKHYHWDWTLIKEDGARFENLVGCHLMKWSCFQQDVEGREVEIRYFRDVDKREVDFVILEEGTPVHFIECKTSREQVSPSLVYLKKRFPEVKATQVLLKKDTDLLTKDDIRISSAHIFLKDFA
ncbi:MAG: ATP-binding protein [Desulfohalobiaceae bacterium]|nr:ATP-binding protein [Desulfohalobiaceae bacterium]